MIANILFPSFTYPPVLSLLFILINDAAYIASHSRCSPSGFVFVIVLPNQVLWSDKVDLIE